METYKLKGLLNSSTKASDAINTLDERVKKEGWSV